MASDGVGERSLPATLTQSDGRGLTDSSGARLPIVISKWPRPEWPIWSSSWALLVVIWALEWQRIDEPTALASAPVGARVGC